MAGLLKQLETFIVSEFGYSPDSCLTLEKSLEKASLLPRSSFYLNSFILLHHHISQQPLFLQLSFDPIKTSFIDSYK